MNEFLEHIYQAFELEKHRYIYIAGGGGKTTLMNCLAQSFHAHGMSVISTTSTQIMVPRESSQIPLFILPEPSQTVREFRPSGPGAWSITMGSKKSTDGKKLQGFSSEELDRLWEQHVSDALIVEADGSAGKSTKAYRDHEPVLSQKANLVIAVVGLDAIGQCLEEKNVHRSDLACSWLQKDAGSILSEEDIAALLVHPEGLLSRIPDSSKTMVFFSKFKTQEHRFLIQNLIKGIQPLWKRQYPLTFISGNLEAPFQLEKPFQK